MFYTYFMPPRSKIRGHIVFVLYVILSFHNSVTLSDSLTLPITYNSECKSMSVLSMDTNISDPVTLTLEFDLFFWKLNFDTVIIFEQWLAVLWHFTLVYLFTRPLHGNQHFLPCALDLGVWPVFWKLNFDINFWTMSARTLIFHTN